MKLTILDTTNNHVGEIDLPQQFEEELRPDILKKAFFSIQSRKRQPYGASPEAGKRASAYVSKRRHKYRGTYGIGQSRTPRKVMSSRGTRFNWVGAFAPQTVGGRRAHPPKAEKIWDQKINKKEKRKAIRAALSAVILKEIVKERGHIVPDNYPFIIENKLESLEKTKDVRTILKNIGLEKELERAGKKKIRAGKGKARGRPYQKRKGPLLVVSKNCKLLKSAANIPGIDIVDVKNINVELLAPGAVQGRLTIFTEDSIKKIEKEKLFT